MIFLFKGFIRNVYPPGSLTASFPLKSGKMVRKENDPASYWVFWSLFRGKLAVKLPVGVYSISRLVTIKVGVNHRSQTTFLYFELYPPGD